MMSDYYTHHQIDSNGVTLHVVQAGRPENPLLILLHGFPEYWRGWINQIEPLADAGFHLWIPDQRGYNLSDKPAGLKAYHIDELARDVIGLIQSASRNQAFVVGHDWGAAVAWHLATWYPEWISKLGILNVPHPNVMISTLQTSRRQLFKSWYIFFFQIPKLPEIVLQAQNFKGMERALLQSSRPGTFTDPALEGYRMAWKQPGALTGMLNWYRSSFRNGLASIARARRQPSIPISPLRVTPPTLMLWGVNDTALDRRMAEPSITLCDHGELIFFEQASHWIQHEEPDRVNEYLINFLSD